MRKKCAIFGGKWLDLELMPGDFRVVIYVIAFGAVGDGWTRAEGEGGFARNYWRLVGLLAPLLGG